MEKELVSIVVPVYNVEKYLPRCIDSLLNQTYNIIEIVIIDDGSTDNCPNICDEFDKRYSCVKVIHKTNGGLADARNIGIEHANGRFITFVDSDDFVSKYYIENLYSALIMGNADLSISMFENLPEDKEIKSKTSGMKKKELYICSSEKCLELLLYQEGIETSAPGKLYKREIIEKLRFPKGRLYEDIMFSTTAISCANKIAIIPNIDYYYFQRRGSIQYQKFTLKKLDCIEFSKELNKFVKDNYPNLKGAADCRYFGALCNIVLQIPKNEFVSERKQLWFEIKEYRKIVIKDSKVRKKTKYAAILSYLGYDLMLFVYQRTQIRGRYLK